MEDSNSGSDDPNVRLRRPNFLTDVRTRYMVLNAERIRTVRHMESMIKIKKDNVETLQVLLLLHMLELGNKEDESLGLSSLSSSDEYSMAESVDT